MLQKERFLLKNKRFDVESNTYKSYNNSLCKLYDKFYFYNKEDFKNIKSDDIEDWLDELTKTMKKSSINLILEHTNEFFNYLLDKHLVDFNPTKAVNKYSESEVSEDAKEKFVPTIEEVKRIVESAMIKSKGERNFDFNGIRNRAILSILAVSGCRQSIVRELRVDMVEEIPNGIAFNIGGKYTKSGKPQRIVFGGKAKEYYDIYIKTRNEFGINSELIFTSAKGGQLSRSNVAEILNKAYKSAKIDTNNKSFSPHCLRNALATYLVNQQVNPIVIKEICHWTQKTSTDMLAKYSTKDVKLFDNEKIRILDIL